MVASLSPERSRIGRTKRRRGEERRREEAAELVGAGEGRTKRRKRREEKRREEAEEVVGGAGDVATDVPVPLVCMAAGVSPATIKHWQKSMPRYMQT